MAGRGLAARLARGVDDRTSEIPDRLPLCIRIHRNGL